MNSNNIKRKPEAWLKSLDMYPKRKMLIVEGIEDKLFIEYLSGTYNEYVIILDVNSINITEKVKNGNKGRLLHIAEVAKNQPNRFKVFIDKDYSSFENQSFNKNVITTDFRDIEAYLYEIDFLDKFLKIGIKTDKICANKLLDNIKMLRYFGFVRITSIVNGLNLSINKTNEKLSKYINLKGDLSFDILEDKYIKSLIQNSNNIIDYDELSRLLKKSIQQFSDKHFKEIVQGKDAIAFIKHLVSKLKFKKDNIENVFWMSFEKDRVKNYKNLSEVVDYIK